nr:hypothetical protein [Amycolatopsis balhimycina]
MESGPTEGTGHDDLLRDGRDGIRRETPGRPPVAAAGDVRGVTTQGLQTDTPRFSAYLASKAALEEFGLTAGRETLSDGVTFTSVRMPRLARFAAHLAYRAVQESAPETRGLPRPPAPAPVAAAVTRLFWRRRA